MTTALCEGRKNRQNLSNIIANNEKSCLIDFETAYFINKDPLDYFTTYRIKQKIPKQFLDKVSFLLSALGVEKREIDLLKIDEFLAKTDNEIFQWAYFTLNGIIKSVVIPDAY